ncbi:MAG: extracellular solute-binding protein [Planctomycetes bacterium]|nr:extracellular solute-binding protein [Planctomycetota bacterium]
MIRIALPLCLMFSSLLCAQGSVAIYCSLDQEFSEEILRDFETRTGIKVEATFDIEQHKTVGLVNRIISEAEGPRGDVFWNNEVGQTIRLKDKGLLEAYRSPQAADIPEKFKDPEGFWTGFAARARVIIYNTKLMGEQPRPTSIQDLLDPRWKGRVGMARPLTGTTITHFAALFTVWGEEKTKRFIDDLLAAEISWQGGNAMTMREVGAGNLTWGYTDTDDANVSRIKEHPTAVIVPDQSGPDAEGTLVIPNSVCLIKGARNPDNAKKLIDFILSSEVEERLARGRSAQIPLRPGLEAPQGMGTIKPMVVDWKQVGAAIEKHGDYLHEKFGGERGEPGAKSKRAIIIAGVCVLLVGLIGLSRRRAKVD